MTKNILLIDGNPLLYSNFFKLGYLQNTKGEATGVLFGFLRALRSYEKKYKSTHLVVVWDTKDGGDSRKLIDSDYKANREMTPQKKMMYGQLPDVQRLISYTKWDQVWRKGYEADEILAYLARKLSKDGSKVTVISPDDDLVQVIDDNISLISISKGVHRHKNDAYVEEKYGVPSDTVLYLRAVTGEISDNIRGLALGRGLMEGFRRFLNTESLNKDLQGREERILGHLRRIQVPQQLIDKFLKNLQLSKHRIPPDLEVTKGKSDKDCLHQEFTKLEFNSLLDTMSDFLKH